MKFPTWKEKYPTESPAMGKLDFALQKLVTTVL
jgi:hypothetical protein